MKYNVISLIFVFSIFSVKLFSQQNVADSLQEQIKFLKGEEKVDALNELSDIYQYINSKPAIEFAEKGIKLAKSINYKKGLAGCYGSLGYCYINSDIEKAIYYTNKALDIRYEIDDKAGISNSTNVLGVIYYYQGDYLTSIEYHLKALKIRESIGDEIKTATSYNNISLVYLALEEYETALEYLNKALIIRERTNNKKGISIIKANIGDIHNRMGKYEKAFEYLNEALRLSKEIGNFKTEAGIYLIIANIYMESGDNKEALKNYGIANRLYIDMDEKHGITQAENGIASIYYNQSEKDLAIKHALIALEYAGQINSLENIAEAADLLQTVYKQKEDYEKAYEYLSLYKTSSDSLKVTDKIKKLAKIEFNYKLNKLKEEQKLEIAQQQIYINWLIITLFLGLIIVVLIIYSYFNKRKINKQLKELNDKLTELNSTKDRFFSIIAHDLRGPFHALLGFSEILTTEIDKLTPDEIKKYLYHIDVTLKRQFELLNNLLDWARIQIESINISFEQLSFSEELNNAVDTLSLTANEKKINLINNIPDNLRISADKNMLQLVLRNLIINSIKFSYPGSSIKISGRQIGDFVEIIVSDNGIGIEENNIEKIFRIDVHHSTPGTFNEKGTGLGLVLCKEIIEKHGGEIRIKAAKGKGTDVSFTLKAA